MSGTIRTGPVESAKASCAECIFCPSGSSRWVHQQARIHALQHDHRMTVKEITEWHYVAAPLEGKENNDG